MQEQENVFLYLPLDQLKTIGQVVRMYIEVLQNCLKTPVVDLLTASAFLGYDVTEIEEGPVPPEIVIRERLEANMATLAKVEAAIVKQHQYIYDEQGNIV